MDYLKQFLKNKLSLILILCIIVCFYPIYNKIIYEKETTSIEIAVDFETIKRIYLSSGVYYKNILTNFKEAGLTSVILKEDTLNGLISEGKATLLKGEEVLNDNRIHRGQYNLIFSRLPRNYIIQPEYSYLIIDENHIFEFTKRNLEIKLGNNRVRDLGWNILEIIAQNEQLLDISLDINPEKISLIQAHNLAVIPEITNHKAFSEEQISSKLTELGKANIKIIKFKDNIALGYKENTQIAAIKINELDKFFGFTEFLTPKGLDYLALTAPNKALKIHYMTTSGNDNKKLTNRALRAITERNAKIIHLDVITDQDNHSENLYKETLSLLQELSQTIQLKGFKINNIENIKKAELNNLIYFQIVANIGVILLFLLFIQHFFHKKSKKLSFSISGSFLALGVVAYLFNNLKLYNEFMALLVAIISPVIIFIVIKNKFLDNQNPNQTKPFIPILLFIFLSSIGIGILINTLLFHYNYFVAIWSFKGVKIANTFPIIFLAIYLFVKPKRIKYLYYVLNRYLASHLTFKYLAITILLFSFFILYIFRTGNYGMLILGQLEIGFRELLENIFIIRPRSKEILFSVPLLIIAINYWQNNKLNLSIKLSIYLFASIVSISQINTFCHLHAPFFISVYRSFLGIFVGAFIGFMFIFIINFLSKQIRKISIKLDTWEN